MKITRLRTQVVHLPIDPPILTAILGTIVSADCVLTFLDTDEGLIGEGLVLTINNRRLGVIHEMIRNLEDLVVGLDPNLGGGAERAGLEGAELPRLRGRFDRRTRRDRQRAVGPARQGGRTERCAPDRRLPRRGADAMPRGGLWLSGSIDDLQKQACASSRAASAR